MGSHVLIVSKPIVPPFRDGSKCFVRELATHLKEVRVDVMSTAQIGEVHEEFPPSVRFLPVYASAGGFTPGLLQNARAAVYLAVLSRAELWHFVFAPNPASSLVGRTLKRLKSTPIIQTVASAPRDFNQAPKLLFGDIVVAQSRATKRRLEEAYEAQGLPPKRIELIPPPAPANLPLITEGQKAQARRELNIDSTAPLILYPGDLEVSQGAARSVQIAAGLKTQLPQAVTLIAYRRKTSDATQIATGLETENRGSHLQFAEEVSDIFSLIAAADVLIFPVDDLYGKVDIPIILLEAFHLGTPVLVSDEGSLEDLSPLQRVSLKQNEFSLEQWLERILCLIHSEAERKQLVEAGRAQLASEYSPENVARSYQRLYDELL